jgi:type IV secretion system protein VirB3
VSALRQVPIHRAMHRPSLILGAERELALLTGLVALVLIVVALSVLSAILGIVLWLVGIAILRQMGKADPLMSRVYLRHLRYQAYYPAHACAFRQER